MGIGEYHHGINSLSRVPGPALSLPIDPWLTPPLLSALPGFLSHPQTGYPSYLTPPVVATVMDTINTRSGLTIANTSPTSSLPSPTDRGGGGGGGDNSGDGGAGDPQLATSLAALR